MRSIGSLNYSTYSIITDYNNSSMGSTEPLFRGKTEARLNHYTEARLDHYTEARHINHHQSMSIKMNIPVYYY